MAQNLAPLEVPRVIRHTQWIVAKLRDPMRVESATDFIETPEPIFGVWHGTQMHTCADGYCETATFGYGDDVRCARCDESYDPARDDTL